MGFLDRVGAIEDLTPQFLRDNYLLGLTFVDEQGNPYPDTWYTQKINTALGRFEEHTQLTVRPVVVTQEKHDYYLKEYQYFAYIQLYQYPLIMTEDTPVVSAVYPTGQFITTFPSEWVRADEKHGQIQLVPTQGTLSQVILGRGGSYLPIIYQGLGYLPHLFTVDYTAGFKQGQVPVTFIDAIAKLTCIDLLSSIGDAINPAGITSLSLGVDGLSESRGYQSPPDFAPAFSGRISQYQRELFGDPRLGMEGLFDMIKQFYRGTNMWCA